VKISNDIQAAHEWVILFYQQTYINMAYQVRKVDQMGKYHLVYNGFHILKDLEVFFFLSEKKMLFKVTSPDS
jgi:hypothetical protein